MYISLSHARSKAKANPFHCRIAFQPHNQCEVTEVQELSQKSDLPSVFPGFTQVYTSHLDGFRTYSFRPETAPVSFLTCILLRNKFVFIIACMFPKQISSEHLLGGGWCTSIHLHDIPTSLRHHELHREIHCFYSPAISY